MNNSKPATYLTNQTINEMIGYRYNPDSATGNNAGVYQNACAFDVADMHPSMWMSKKDIRKVKRSMFWYDIRHFYRVFVTKKKLKDWQKNIINGVT